MLLFQIQECKTRISLNIRQSNRAVHPIPRQTNTLFLPKGHLIVFEQVLVKRVKRIKCTIRPEKKNNKNNKNNWFYVLTKFQGNDVVKRNVIITGRTFRVKYNLNPQYKTRRRDAFKFKTGDIFGFPGLGNLILVLVCILSKIDK